MRLLLIGAPGAGKGTQATRIAEHFGLVHLSSGDLLRENVKAGTDVGLAAKAFMDSGDLVPDEVVLEMLREPVIAAAAAGGYVLDGFPRTVQQAEAGYDITKPLGVAVQVAVHLEVPRDALVARIVERGLSSGRADDTEEVVRHRLDVYDAHALPLLAYYRERERLLTVDGDLPMDEVTASVVAQLEQVRQELDAEQ